MDASCMLLPRIAAVKLMVHSTSERSIIPTRRLPLKCSVSQTDFIGAQSTSLVCSFTGYSIPVLPCIYKLAVEATYPPTLTGTCACLYPAIDQLSWAAISEGSRIEIKVVIKFLGCRIHPSQSAVIFARWH